MSGIKHAITNNAFTEDQNINKVISIEPTAKPLFVKIVIDDSVRQNLAFQISNPNLDKVTLYRLNSKNEIIDSSTIAETDPIELREIPEKNFSFKLKPEHSHSSIYFKIEAGEQLLLPLEINTVDVIRQKGTKRDNAVYFYLGIMLVMLLYNLFIYINTKETNYLYYVLFILFVALTQLTLQGFLHKYLPESFNSVKINSVYINGALSGIFTLLFVQSFIETKRYLGKLNYIIQVFIFADIIALACLPFHLYQLSYTLININAGLGSFIVLFMAAYIAYRGNRSAKFFLIAWSLFLSSVIVFVLKDFGIVEYNGFTRFILLYGSAIEVTLLSLALADKINLLKKEKDLAQADALKIAQENARITKEQNIMLEQKVNERTKALTESNQSLSSAIAELKQAQAQLVESEKMASLGQLTAGIAHEINNPINFVTSNVKPLQRDIQELYNLIQKSEDLASKQELNHDTINKLKKDIDYDYLQTEINYLLKGIQEGSSRTAEIVKGLRIFSRVDEDDIKLADINDGLDSTIIIVNNQLNNKIKILKEYGDLGKIECYPGKLNQVFLNLITNGIYAVKQKYGEEEGGVVHISTKLVNDNVQISISDNGTGMSESTKAKLFEPFFTTKPVGEGTGLGLSIVYNTIKKHSGSINVESVVGEGTTFVITLPKKI
ncbi:MAG: 7TM diverse intracellular signaling domain-containing protein [Bacteroidota bacterium]